jgi:hypothetical protein
MRKINPTRIFPTREFDGSILFQYEKHMLSSESIGNKDIAWKLEKNKREIEVTPMGLGT